MSNYTKTPSEGDRIDIGGKLPQFDAFAWFIYKELIQNNLDWIRVADPEAKKLDDIQYSTKSEIRAYQVKWSNLDKPAPFSYNDFVEILPEIHDGWKALCSYHQKENKKVFAFLLTNRPLSKHDSIKYNDKKIGSFQDFYNQVFVNIKNNLTIDPKWNPIIDEVLKLLKLNINDLTILFKNIDIRYGFTLQKFQNDSLIGFKQREDVLQLSRFIIQEIANTKQTVQFSSVQLINLLSWEERFYTTFQHDLIIDKKKYQPINETIIALNEAVEKKDNGYIFLIGGPGTGKSTLLSQWVKKRNERIVKYFAFDFTNPGSQNNYHIRGESMTLFYDLVIQLKNVLHYSEEILPFKDLNTIRNIFFRQLASINDEYKVSGIKTLIIIDGLDHIPREYKTTKNSFLADLPAPSEIPQGVIIVLGSQSYELDDLNTDVKQAWKEAKSNILISPLDKKSVFKLIDSSEIQLTITEKQKEIFFEKSQGHPLYSSYLIGKIKSENDVDKVINGFIPIDGDIDKYYDKIWETISSNNKLVEFLGLLSRIKGNINPAFIKEWNFDEIYPDFKTKAAHLFDSSKDRLAFFHNSFKQFLINNSSINILTGDYDYDKDNGFYAKLVSLYDSSKIEPRWKKLFHLYKIGKYSFDRKITPNNAFENFIEETTTDNFLKQFSDYRPPDDIKEDIRVGIEIANHKKDIYLLTRYLFCLAEFDLRLFHVDPGSFIEEFLFLGKTDIIKNYLRYETQLRCSKEFALSAARLFFKFNDPVEAKFLFSLGEPEGVYEDEIIISDNHQYDELRHILEEWTKSAPLFYSVDKIISLLFSIKFNETKNHSYLNDTESDLRKRLFFYLGEQLINYEKWEDLEKIIFIFNDKEKDDHYSFLIYRSAIEKCLEIGNVEKSNFFLKEILRYTIFEKASAKTRVRIANLIYTTTGDLDLVKKWISEIPQPNIQAKLEYGVESSLAPFMFRICLTKLQILTGQDILIKEAVPDSTNVDESVLVEFERMLCIITKILCESITGNYTISPINIRVRPLVEFYYKTISPSHSYWYKLTERKKSYYEFLIFAVSRLGEKELKELADYFWNEFKTNGKYYSSKDRRNIILNFLESGFNPIYLTSQLKNIESIMLEGHDISGRIDECILQCKAWIRFENKTDADIWLNRAILESIGIGYRKDYQFSEWVRWLQKINVIQPDNAGDRILWMLSQLKHIKEITEGGAYHSAAEILLETTFKWNFNNGLIQLIWQLKNGLIDFEDAIGTFIKETLEYEITFEDFKLVLNIFNEILLLVAETDFSYYLKIILQKGFEKYKNEFLSLLPSIISSIRIIAVEDKRINYFLIIHAFLEENNISKDIDFIYLPEKESLLNKDENQGSNSITLTSSKHLTEKEVIGRIKNFDDFKNILLDEDQDRSYFNWAPVIERTATNFTISDFLEILSLYKKGRRSSFFYAIISKQLLRLGDKDTALKIANKAIDSSSSSGWITHYDGGSRIKAFDALRNISPNECSEKAFITFSNDIFDSSSSRIYIEHLDEILPLLSEDINLSLIWTEIESYLQRLFSNSIPLSDLPVFEKEKKEISSTIIDLLIYLCKSPVNIINEKALCLLVSQISDSNKYTKEKLEKLVSNNEEDEIELFINILLFLNEFSPSHVSMFSSSLKMLVCSENYFIRNSANNLLKLIGFKDDLPIPAIREINPILTWSLAKVESLKKGIIKEHEFVEDTDDPDILIRPFNIWIKHLSDITQIPEINLIYRTIEILKTIDTHQKHLTKYEKSIRNNLENIRLKYSYPRPRAEMTKRSIMHLISELIDNGTLKNNESLKFFDFYDYKIEFIEEIEKPPFIVRLKKDEHSFFSKSWVDEINSSQRINETIFKYLDSWNVISEYSIIKSLEWGISTETYMSQLMDRKNGKENVDSFFDYFFNKKVKDYYNSHPSPSILNLIVNNDHRFTRFDLKSNWIAFNPKIANELKWVPDNSAIFAWKNNDGSQMAKSVYWKNGNIYMEPYHTDSESGEGWFVICSDKALEMIFKKFDKKNLYIKVALEREYNRDGTKMYNNVISRKPIHLK